MTTEPQSDPAGPSVRGRVTSLPLDPSRDIKDGRRLAGDEFSERQCAVWFAQEAEAFYDSDEGNSDVDPWYAYMRFVNDRLGFAPLEHAVGEAGSLLALGPGSGIELEGFSRRHPAWALNFLEASANFRTELRRKWPRSTLVEPMPSGDIRLADDSQNIICAFSVLHHIPNVSHVVREIFRVAAPGGFLLVREPCSSMGDWRRPRSATPNERGISRALMTTIAREAGFESHRAVPVIFEPINKFLKQTIGYSSVPFGMLYGLDRAISFLLAANDHYWRDTWYKKLGPSSYFYVFQKPPHG